MMSSLPLPMCPSVVDSGPFPCSNANAAQRDLHLKSHLACWVQRQEAILEASVQMREAAEASIQELLTLFPSGFDQGGGLSARSSAPIPRERWDAGECPISVENMGDNSPPATASATPTVVTPVATPRLSGCDRETCNKNVPATGGCPLEFGPFGPEPSSSLEVKRVPALIPPEEPPSLEGVCTANEGALNSDIELRTEKMANARMNETDGDAELTAFAEDALSPEKILKETSPLRPTGGELHVQQRFQQQAPSSPRQGTPSSMDLIQTKSMHDMFHRPSQVIVNPPKAMQHVVAELEQDVDRFHRCMHVLSSRIPRSLLQTQTNSCIGRSLNSTHFVRFTAFIISANVVFIAFTTQYAIDHLGEEQPASLDTVEMCFHAYYITEFIMKLWVYRLNFFTGHDVNWNMFDMMLIGTALYDIWTVFLGSQGLNVTFLRVLRLFRMLKVLRVVKVLKHFRELRLMISAIMGSLSTFFWCLLMLLCVLSLCSLIFVQASIGYLSDLDDIERSPLGMSPETGKLVEYWGTLPKALNTMYQAVTGGGDWGEFADPLKLLGYHMYFFFCLNIGFLILAVLNVLTGTFCANAVGAAIRDRDNVAYLAAKTGEAFKDDVRALFKVIDDDQSGSVSWEEFQHHMGMEEMNAYLKALEIDVKDAEFFFLLLAQHSPNGEVGIDMFLDGCQRLKGDAKMIDVQTISCQIRVLHKSQEQVQRYMETMFQRMLSDPAARRPGFTFGSLPTSSKSQ